jgi:hypothetical protein
MTSSFYMAGGRMLWDTDNLIEINRLIYNMADWHLEQAKEQNNQNVPSVNGGVKIGCFRY